MADNRLLPKLRISPPAGIVGTHVTLKATGLAKKKNYRIMFGALQVGEFKASAKPATPRSKTFVVPRLPATGDRGELGSKVTVSAVTDEGPAAQADFEFRASVRLSRKEAGVGYKVTIEAQGLLADQAYFVTTVENSKPDVAVALLSSTANGDGQSEFIVPNTLRAGSYQIQIKNRQSNYLAIRDPPVLNFLGYSNSSLVPGKPIGPVSQPYCPALVSFPFTSELSIPMTGTLYAVIYKSGKAYKITSSALSLPPSGAGDSPVCFADLEPGVYKVMAFVATMTGAALSRTITIPLIIDKQFPEPGYQNQ